jgi:hypothetical protein
VTKISKKSSLTLFRSVVQNFLDSDEQFVEFHPAFLKQMDWRQGDVLVWKESKIL